MRSIKPLGVIGATALFIALFLCLAGSLVLASPEFASSPAGGWYPVKTNMTEDWGVSLDQVQFIDPSLAYGTADGELYCSTDGGFDWYLAYRPPAENFYIERFFFLDAQHGWMVESSCTQGAPHGGPWNYYVLHTTDGGSSWTRAHLLYGNLPRAFSDMVFFDQSTGFLAGGGFHGLGAYIWKTEDGGLTWRLFHDEDAEWLGAAAVAMSFVDPQHGWLVADWNPSYERSSAEVVRTTDGGLTWVRLSGYEALMPPSPWAFLMDLDFVDVNTGWAVGSEGTILHTADAGLTWTKQAAPTTEELRAVDFLDPLTGWVVGWEGTILHTRDGGRHWEDVSPVGLSSSLDFVQFLDRSHGWALGDQGELFRYISADTGEFGDVPGSRNDIYALVREGIVQGYEDGSFRPDNPVLRAQLAKMLVGALRIPVADGAVPCPFSDVPRGPVQDPLYPDDFVAVAAAKGIVQGFTSTFFGPYQPVTRIQMVSMVVRALERLRPGRLEEPPAGWSFDWPETADPAHGRNVSLAEYNGLLSHWWPWEVGRLYEAATRGEMAQMLYAALGGEFAPLWPLKVSTTTLAELAQELKSRFSTDWPIYLPRRLPAGWGIAEAPLPKNPWLCEPGAANPFIEAIGGGYYIVFTDGSTMVELIWPTGGDYGSDFTAYHDDGILYCAGDVHMDLKIYNGAAPWVHLRSQIWARDAIRAIAGAVEEVRR